MSQDARRFRDRLPAAVRHPLERIGAHELGVLVTLLAIVAGIWAFAALADEVAEGETRSFDTKVLLAMRAPGDPSVGAGPKWMPIVMRDLTALGGLTVLSLAVAAVSGFLLIRRRYSTLALVLGTTFTGAVVSGVLKRLFARPRPDVVPHLTEVASSSFPSGHSMLSAVVYLTLGAILAKVESRRRVRAYLLAVAVLVTFLVGLSRVYLGVHYPTDVLGGWTAGLVWALFCFFVARTLQRHGKIEGPPS